MAFIIEIEGTDGSGKQTQTKKLFDFFIKKGLSVKQTSFPNYESISSGPVKMYLNGELCENVDEINAYQASILYTADRLCTMKAQEKSINEADIVILDRYTGSNLLHQACKIKDTKERERYITWINDLEFNILKLPKPDLILFLDMPFYFTVAVAKARKNNKCGLKSDIHEKNLEYLKFVYDISAEIAKNQNWKIITCKNGEKVKSIDEIHKEIVDVIKNNLPLKLKN